MSKIVKKTFGWRKFDKFNLLRITKMKIIGMFMDLRLWFYFNKKHLAVPFRNSFSRKNIF